MEGDRPFWYTVPQACGKTSLGRSKLYELIRSGEIPTVRIGRAVRIPAKALEAFCDRYESGSES
jgi:excisionase family DNA binding protein